MSRHIRGGRKCATRTIGFRQAAGHQTKFGKDPIRGRPGQGTDGACVNICGETPTADFAISGLVRTRTVMSSRPCFSFGAAMPFGVWDRRKGRRKSHRVVRVVTSGHLECVASAIQHL